MSRFIIQGQHPLHGTIVPTGMKNAATPILAATLLTHERCIISNVPRIADVFNMVALLKSLGAEIAWHDEHVVSVECQDIDPAALDQSIVQKLRSSVLLIGPLIARFPSVTLARPGGCIIGNRPLDTHVEGLKGLGVHVEEQEHQLLLTRTTLSPVTIVLSEFSVTATENILMAASLVPGVTILHIAAMEPHIQDLCTFLIGMGATIQGVGTHTLEIHGAKALHGTQHTIIPDQIEIGTWAVAAAATHGEVTISGVEPKHVHLILLKMRAIGIQAELAGTALSIKSSGRFRPFKLQALPYPGFPSDLQAPFSVLATQAEGMSMLHDPLYEGRLSYIPELVKMGANAVICDPHRVLISGPTPLYGQEIQSYDLRAGATLIIAALIAKGKSVLHEAEIVDRGYEAIDARLRALGADITRDD